MAGLRYTPPQGAYYVMVDISPFGWKRDTDFCKWMIRTIGVAAVPGSSFFHEPVHHLIRLHFAKRIETIEEAGTRLVRLKEFA
jgi:aspartate/methionine/tyrosine aminotransferase